MRSSASHPKMFQSKPKVIDYGGYVKRDKKQATRNAGKSKARDASDKNGETKWRDVKNLPFCQRETPMELWPQPLSQTKGASLLGYARVSTDDQRLDMQFDALTRAACTQVYYDHGVSGAKAARPGLDELLDALQAGDTLVVYKMDRLGRSVLHLADLLTRLDKDGVHFCSLTEGINTATPGGKLVFHIFAAIAEFHRDLIRENTRNGLAAARTRGARLGRPPKLSVEDVVEAHRLLHQEGWSVASLLERFEVSESTLLRGLRRLV
ncbi:MAG: recombinase family protein [Hyphomicrobiales bacterium]